MHSHGHVSLKVTLLITTHHMTVRSCDPESVQYEATTKTVTPVVYQLMLPPQWKQKRIHDVFHASLLTPYHETTEHGPNFPTPPPDVIKGEMEYEVERILDSRCVGRGRHLEYLVRWKGYSEADDSWEPRQNIHAPDLLQQFHATYPSAIQASYINPLDLDDVTPKH